MRSARVRMAAASEPASGSLSPNLATKSPRRAGIRYFWRKASLPHWKIVLVAVEACMQTMAAKPMEPRASSSQRMV